MVRKRFNWKARQVVKTDIDDAATKKIQLDIKSEEHYDKCNALVLPSKKRKSKIIKDKTFITRILSKQHRKRLEKVVDKKKKKENRSALLEALSQVQATPEELSQLTSIASVQTKGLKRYFFEQQYPHKITAKERVNKLDETLNKINSISGSKRKCLEILKNDAERTNDANIVGFEKSSSEDESDNEIEQIVNKKAKLNDEIIQNDEINNITDKSEDQSIIIVEKRKKPIIFVDDNAKIKNAVVRKPATFVEVYRKDDIQQSRLKLPILAEEQQIMETINENSIIILAGETGSGKTTQVPQFLYEAGYAMNNMIGITEPRRVAAISMSKRVAEEMDLTSSVVSYLIRFEGNATDDTKLKFMTDGVLLKEIQSDFLLSKYSVVILDEAHERSVYTDILIGLLSRIVPLRNKRGNPMKLIIMSATLRLQDFTDNKRLFKITPPVIKVEARQFPVTVHFNKRTNDNYLKETFSKAVKVHRRLPDGGILIFVTGQQEVNTLVRKLRKLFPLNHKKNMLTQNKDVLQNDIAQEDGEPVKKRCKNKKRVKILPQIDLDEYCVPDNEDPDLSDDENNLNEDSDTEEIPAIVRGKPLWVLPLYSLLASHKQAEVFKPPPPGCRLCVVSTNVAETSLTIPNVKYVIDAGKTKVKLYDKTTGVSSYVVTWTSVASADQRAGRAGRTSPGHCYRLYSSAVFNDTFVKFSVPEIQLKPVDDLFLQMKCMNIDKVINFPFPTAPDLLQLKTAEHRLEILGALKNGHLTQLGRAIAKFPVLPRYGKMLALSHQQDLLPYTICMVAAFSVQEVLLETPILPTGSDEIKNVRQQWMSIRRQWGGMGNSLLLGDPMVLLRAVGAAEYANSVGKLGTFCISNGLRPKAVSEIRKLRIQLTNEIKTNMPDSDIVVDPQLQPPDDLQAKLLRQIILAGMGDQVAKKVLPDELKENEDKSKFKYAYKANNMEDPVFLHQGSILKKTLPEFVVYQEIYETNKMYMRGVTAIEPEWLAQYVPHLCNFSEPLMDPEPRYDTHSGKVFCTVTGTFGPQAWPLPNIDMEFPNTIDHFKWFARFVLEGKVFVKLNKYRKSLLSVPSTMVKTWAKLQQKTDAILKEFIRGNVCTKNGLADVWRENPKYLLAEYLKWLPESAQSEVTLLWPPLD